MLQMLFYVMSNLNNSSFYKGETEAQREVLCEFIQLAKWLSWAMTYALSAVFPWCEFISPLVFHVSLLYVKRQNWAHGLSKPFGEGIKREFIVKTNEHWAGFLHKED